MAKVTLKDVAKKADVSYQTVSKVLNNKGNVTPETEARIWQAVQELGYRPNISARNLRTQSSNLIGYGWQQSDDGTPHPVLNHFLYSAVQRAEAHHYHMLAFLLSEDAAENTNLYRELFGRRQVDGFILADTNEDDPRIQFLMEQNIPFASFGRANEDWDFCWVDVDGRSGIQQVTQHFQERGHERIGLITWPEGSKAGNEREQGYHHQIEAVGHSIQSDWILRGENSVQHGYQLMQQLLALPADERPTAVACVSDLLAIGAINAAMAHGLTVGQEIAIAGYDNIPMSEFLYPPLTTVAQPIQEAGQQVIELLLKQINGEEIEEKGMMLEPKLIIRESS